MSNVVAMNEPNQVSVMTPMDMLNKAVAQGADINVLEKLMGLQERWEANQARKAFDEAMAAAKAEIPAIVRNRAGHNSKKYADFAAIAAVVDPILSRHGLSYRFRSAQDERINVTCVLSHKAGHSEETTLAAPADTTGNKNAVQAIGSTLTYLQRYSLVQALGLAAADDDDGASSTRTGSFITEEQAAQLVELAEDVGADKVAFCKYLKVDSLAAIKDRDFDRAIAALNKKRART